ncbi:DsbA family protein [Paraburkholderia bannensis]|uniref:DsbA family protein n=1 Tax=Paraburkholderia bannensis TaxID=765414 RepID=UPI002AC32085|nr:DsbA family protein [Paraburkholderia bannensis]
MRKAEARAVFYVMDAYCGWCWGLSPRMIQFEAANRDRIAFTAISGGLFTGQRAAPLSAYPHIPEANARIEQTTGVRFGSAYQTLLKDGSMVMDSEGAAIALAALRDVAPERALNWAHHVQEAFYVHGQSLSDISTIRDIANRNGLDEDEVMQRVEDGTARAAAHADFVKAARLGVTSYPTLLFIDGSRVHQLPATGSTLEDLTMRLDALI